MNAFKISMTIFGFLYLIASIIMIVLYAMIQCNRECNRIRTWIFSNFGLTMFISLWIFIILLLYNRNIRRNIIKILIKLTIILIGGYITFSVITVGHVGTLLIEQYANLYNSLYFIISINISSLIVLICSLMCIERPPQNSQQNKIEIRQVNAVETELVQPDGERNMIYIIKE